jgi:hypothetical protein
MSTTKPQSNRKKPRPAKTAEDSNVPSKFEHRDAFRFHGTGLRGAAQHPGSPLFEARFGRMFRPLPAAKFAEEDLAKLAAAMVAEHEDDPTPETEVDNEENQGIDAGYTYLGQFIDHDLTFDPASSLEKQNDPDALVDFRTPRFDLDSVYGRGPDDQPYLYQADGLHMLLGRPLTGNPHDPNTRDLPRNTPQDGEPSRALIGDPRNDENVIVSQLQGIMLRFHNSMVRLLTKDGKSPRFEDVQRQVRWHYQWVVLNDFLLTIVGSDTLNQVLPHLKKGTNIAVDKPELHFFSWHKEPYIPIEFSVAAYRFGHSMVRPIYRLNTTLPIRFAIFSDDPNTSLGGFREFPEPWAIEWNLFFKMGNSPKNGPERVQKAYKIDTSLVNPLGKLPGFASHPSLADRNLLRGLRMGLPSGQSVARHMHLDVIPNDKLKVGKATEEDSKTNKPLVDLSPAFKENAPLWYYILAEAQQQFVKDSTPIRLGPVGGRIVAEVFAGLLLGDHHSFLSQDPTWRPISDLTQGGKFGMAELISAAIKT